MTDKELERALRGALRPGDPGADFTARVMARLETERRSSRVPAAAAAAAARVARRRFYRWSAPAALAACALAAVGLVHWRYETAARARGIEARAQLLQALRIASAQVSGARTAVLRDEGQLE